MEQTKPLVLEKKKEFENQKKCTVYHLHFFVVFIPAVFHTENKLDDKLSEDFHKKGKVSFENLMNETYFGEQEFECRK